MIDVHTHLFNLKYFPVSGILQSYSKGAIPSFVADALEFLLIRATKHDLDINSQDFQNINLNENFLEQPLHALRLSPQLNINFNTIKGWNEAQLIENTAILFSPSDFNNKKVQKALQFIEEDHNLSEASIPEINGMLFSISQPQIQLAQVVSQEEIEELFGNIQSWFVQLLNWVFRKLESGYHWLRWFRFLMNSEKHMYNQLIGEYGDNIACFIYHTLDLDHSFAGNSTFDYETQIDHVQTLTQKSDGVILPFVSFDPQRIANKRTGAKSSLEIVIDAIENKGFRGAKFYPPLGYRPYYRKEPGKPLTKREEFINNKNLEFFRYCLENQIPVFTHCTPTGFEADRANNSGKNSNPLYWEHLLQIDDNNNEIPDDKKMHNLILCLGHAGGSKGWFANGDEATEKYKWNGSYAKKAVQLCRKYPNVYCEVGFLAEVHDHRRVDYFKTRLGDLLKENTTNAYPYYFHKKVMYGSDWHLLYNHGIEDGYFDKYEAIFAFTDMIDFKHDFFEGNARRYLGMPPAPVV